MTDIARFLYSTGSTHAMTDWGKDVAYCVDMAVDCLVYLVCLFEEDEIEVNRLSIYCNGYLRRVLELTDFSWGEFPPKPDDEFWWTEIEDVADFCNRVRQHPPFNAREYEDRLSDDSKDNFEYAHTARRVSRRKALGN